MTSFFNILAQDAAQPSAIEAFLAGPIPMMVAIFLMFYFLFIRPQQKQKKELQARIDSLKKGDQVVTVGGLHATVHHKGDKDTVTLKISEGIYVAFSKSAVQSVIKKESADEVVSEEKPEKK